MPSPSLALHLPVEDSTTSPRCHDGAMEMVMEPVSLSVLNFKSYKVATCSLHSRISNSPIPIPFFARNIYCEQKWFRCLYIFISCSNLNPLKRAASHAETCHDQPSRFGRRYLVFKRAHSATGIVYHLILILLAIPPQSGNQTWIDSRQYKTKPRFSGGT